MDASCLEAMIAFTLLLLQSVIQVRVCVCVCVCSVCFPLWCHWMSESWWLVDIACSSWLVCYMSVHDGFPVLSVSSFGLLGCLCSLESFLKLVCCCLFVGCCAIEWHSSGCICIQMFAKKKTFSPSETSMTSQVWTNGAARWTEHPNVTQQYLSRVRTGNRSTFNNTSQQKERARERERENEHRVEMTEKHTAWQAA